MLLRSLNDTQQETSITLGEDCVDPVNKIIIRQPSIE
jgi:hypothetical protein